MVKNLLQFLTSGRVFSITLWFRETGYTNAEEKKDEKTISTISSSSTRKRC